MNTSTPSCVRQNMYRSNNPFIPSRLLRGPTLWRFPKRPFGQVVNLPGLRCSDGSAFALVALVSQQNGVGMILPASQDTRRGVRASVVHDDYLLILIGHVVEAAQNCINRPL